MSVSNAKSSVSPAFPMNQIFNEDNLDTMRRMPDCIVDLIVTSPPYNVGQEYERGISFDEWLAQMESTFREAMRVLAHGGRIAINLANTGRKPYRSLTAHTSMIMERLGFLNRGEIIWNKEASVGASIAVGTYASAKNPCLRDVHEYILVFSKNIYEKANEDRVSTLFGKDFMTHTQSVWTIRTESAKKIGHPCPFPVEIPRRLINLYTYVDDVVYDPFMGSGTTAIAAIELGRNWIGSEINKEYCQLANERIEGHLSQKSLFDVQDALSDAGIREKKPRQIKLL